MGAEAFPEPPAAESRRLCSCELDGHFVNGLGASQAGNDFRISQPMDDHLAYCPQDAAPHLRRTESGHVLHYKPHSDPSLPDPFNEADGRRCPLGQPGKLVDDNEDLRRAVTAHRRSVDEVFDDPARRHDALHGVSWISEIDVDDLCVVIARHTVQEAADR